MRTRSMIITGVVLSAPLLAFLLVGNILAFKAQEVKFCKRFVLDNSAAQDYFGPIKSVRLVRTAGGREVGWTSNGKISHGTYHFRVKGAKRKGRIRVHWRTAGGTMKVSQLSIRAGLAGTRVIWPEYQDTSIGYIFPSNVCDGIILFCVGGLCLLFYAGFKKRARWATMFYFAVPRSERMQNFIKWIWAFSAFTSFVGSILCFLNIWTLF